jgi:hypothetical protein
VIARIELLVLLAALAVGALASGADFLFFLLYLVILVALGAYFEARLGLSNLEAGFALGQLHGTVGEHLRVTYTVRNAGRLPKPWLGGGAAIEPAAGDSAPGNQPGSPR